MVRPKVQASSGCQIIVQFYFSNKQTTSTLFNIIKPLIQSFTIKTGLRDLYEQEIYQAIKKGRVLLDFRRRRLKWHRSTKPECVVGLTLSLTQVEDRSVSFKNLIDFVARCLESALTLGRRDAYSLSSRFNRGFPGSFR